jgi:hypothetical protein
LAIQLAAALGISSAGVFLSPLSSTSILSEEEACCNKENWLAYFIGQ